MRRRGRDGGERAAPRWWLRLRVALFVQSVSCRHDGTSPQCLWCGIASGSDHPLGLDALARPS